MNILLLLSVVAAFVPCRNRRVIGMNGSQLTSVEIVLMHHDDDVSDKIDNDVTDTDTPRHSSTKTRRQFFQQQLLASTTLIPTLASAANSDIGDGYFSLRNNNNMPYAQRQQLARQQQREQQQMADKQQKVLSNISSKKWTPFLNVNKWDSVETCLLEMLPVKNGVFRRLQELIENLEVCEANDAEGWKQTLLDTLTALALLESKRSSLEPVFNQEDPTELYIAKSSIGERNIEALRSKLEELIMIASGGVDGDMNIKSIPNKGNINYIATSDIDNIPVVNPNAFLECKKEALFALAEVGELLVPSFPYTVPTRGKFGYLPRLLGRCTVTLSFERPSPSSSFGFALGNEKQTLGNVTIVADGYAAPITAGNFVDLSLRNFYTGLSVKAMRKRLGVIPSWSDNGFYDPLTAKPRRIPLEVRSFSSSISSSSSNSTTTAAANLNPVLSFDIPNIVALNHPDRVSNGGSSEFFALPIRDNSPKRSKLLDGQYAPFGYIVKGSEVYQSLRPGDIIKATYVSELGQLNLVKIIKNAFEGGGDDDAVREEEDESGQ
ncbi:predicted protein [Thalassiosira pseudonana CCMP1335]|uniref:peptidylprolyl isomerase n=1 Tax=Thalassiosira pseudonana TaxID=35128 RepID=B8C2Z3_THAPS|nr:predicted protein [Thalassiosira pseudonana CCMP1335]EED92467.1 predicted protein [Thalassiosira pseudonana CCMP1335]